MRRVREKMAGSHLHERAAGDLGPWASVKRDDAHLPSGGLRGGGLGSV